MDDDYAINIQKLSRPSQANVLSIAESDCFSGYGNAEQNEGDTRKVFSSSVGTTFSTAGA